MKRFSFEEIEKIRNSLAKISYLIRDIYRDKSKVDSFKSDRSLYYRTKVKKFKYSKLGIDLHSTTQVIEKKEWYSATKEIADITKGSKEYKKNLKVLKPYLNQMKVDSFAEKIANHCLEKTLGKKIVKTLIDFAIKDIKNESRFWGIADISGMAIQPHEIKINSEITLRRICKTDLETELEHWSFHSEWNQKRPSIRIHVKLPPEDIRKKDDDFKSGTLRKLSDAISKVTTILRLFKVGGVKCIAHEMDSDSIFPMLIGRTTDTNPHNPFIWSYVKKNEIKKLNAFFRVMNEHFPKSLYEFGTGKVNSISIANNFYSEAVLKNEPIEKRISYAIMGLEALFLSDTIEVGYKLRMRASKFLGFFGFDVAKIKVEIRDAYDIRSIYAHGSSISTKRKKRLESNHGSLENLSEKVLNYLRVSILLNIFMKKSKEKFVDLIDGSLIDSKKSDVLKKSLDKWKKYIVIK